MIRIAIMYPNQPDKQFDLGYYQSTHLPLAEEKYTPYGLKGIELDVALSTEGKQAAPYLAIGYLLFDSIDQFLTAIEAEGKVVRADVANFTDIEPVIQVSQCLESSLS